jgi:hypothetical protein
MKKVFAVLSLLFFVFNTYADEWIGRGYYLLDNQSSMDRNWEQEIIKGDESTMWAAYGGLYTPYKGGYDEGHGNAYFSVWDALGNSIGDEVMLISEVFQNNVDNSYVKFWHHQVDYDGGNNRLEVYYRTSTTSDWVLLKAFNDPIEDWREDLILLPEQSSTMQIGFKGILTGGDKTQGVALDYVSFMYSADGNFTPSNVFVGDITTTTAKYSWEQLGDATSWTVEYGEYGFTLGEGTSISTTNPQIVISNLNPGTHYDFYVKGNFGELDSDWSDVYSFYTIYETVVDFPYEEKFDNSNFNEDSWRDGIWVNGWYEEYGKISENTEFTGLDADWQPRKFGDPKDYNPDEADCMSTRTFGVYSWLISPTFDLGNTNDFQLVFDISATDSYAESISLTDTDTIAVVVSTDGGNSWSSDNIIRIWDASHNPSEITAEGLHTFVDLTEYNGDVKIAFYVSGNSMNTIYVDNIKVKKIPTNPELELLEPLSWTPRPLLVNTTTNSGEIFTIRNSGTGNLSFTSISDLSSTEFSANFDKNVIVKSGETYSFSFDYSPVDNVDEDVTFTINSDYGSCNIILHENSYELTECEVEIGIETENIGLPLDFYKRYSFSQSIYTQEEIGRDDGFIKTVYYYYSGENDSERFISIYMAHTDKEEFSTWESMSEFQNCASDVLVDFQYGPGWYEIPLAHPFKYNNVDNLIVGFASSVTGTPVKKDQYIYSHPTPDGKLMSMVASSDNYNLEDLDNLPDTNPIAFRPNIRFCIQEEFDEIIIADEALETATPIDFNQNFSYSQFIYTQAFDLKRSSNDQKIYRVSFYFNGEEDLYANKRIITLSMKHIEKDAFIETIGESLWEDPAVDFEVVFEPKTVKFEAEGWYDFILDHPFAYNNTDNIMITLYSDATAKYHQEGPSFLCHTANNGKYDYGTYGINRSFSTHNDFGIDLENLPPKYGTRRPIPMVPNIKFSFKNEEDLGLNTRKANHNIYIWPNPANDFIRISGVNNGNIQILDITGKIVKEIIYKKNSIIDISALEKGVYFVKSEISTRKFIVK